VENFGDYYRAGSEEERHSDRYTGTRRDANRYAPRETHRAFNYRTGQNYLVAAGASKPARLTARYVDTSRRAILHCRDITREI